MNIDNIYNHILRIQIEVRLDSLFDDAVRLARVNGLEDRDLKMIKMSILKEKQDAIKDDIEKALKQNIPGFTRLCEFCEGQLDCTSDHK
jgi:hypothetical protein